MTKFCLPAQLALGIVAAREARCWSEAEAMERGQRGTADSPAAKPQRPD